jgi:hypothetical protein
LQTLRSSEETNMSRRRVSGAALLVLFGCAENPLIPDPNMAPRANANADQVVPFAGAEVAVTLDASFSTDMDGQIQEYRWMSATTPPMGGTGRYVPPGEAADWPPNEMTTVVNLPEGVWTLALQVVDDKGTVSAPDYVMVTVGDAPPPAAGAGGAPGGAGGRPAGGSGGGGAGGAGGA